MEKACRCDRRRAGACVVVVELAIRVRREVVVVLAEEIEELAFEVYFVEELVEDGLDGREHRHPRVGKVAELKIICLLYTSPSPRDRSLSRMPSSA